MADLPDPFDRTVYRRLLHREWVLMYQHGVGVEQIARLNQRPAADVHRYLAGVYQHSPELFHDRPRREVVYDRPRPRPDTWPDRDQRFKATLAQLEAFLTAHGRRPYFGDHSTTEGRLTHWLKVQRSKDRHGQLLGHRARWLTDVLPGWRTDTRALHYDAQWRATLARVVAYHIEHGTLPRRNRDPAQKNLGRWLQGQRDLQRHGALDAARKAALDTHLPRWDRIRA